MLALGGGAKFALQAEIDQRARGLPLDRGIALGERSGQPLFELGDPAA